MQQRLHRLLDAVVSIASDLSLPDTLRRITEVAAELVDAQYAALGVLGNDRHRLSEFITVGFDPPARGAPGDPPFGQGILGLLIDDPRPLRVDDLSTQARLSALPPGHPPMTSFLGVPIRVRGAVFGNLYLTQKRDGGTFSEGDQEVVVALAAAAGIAIENSRLFEETRRREQWLAAATEVTEHLLTGAPASSTNSLVVAKAAQMTSAQLAFLLLTRDDGHLTVAAGHGGIHETYLGRSYRLADDVAAVVFGNERAHRSAGGTPILLPLDPDEVVVRDVGPSVVVPLVGRGGMLGMLTVVRPRDGTLFSEAAAHMVQSFAGHAALAVEFSRVNADRERLAVLEDRDRIAHDLHDLVIQRLFAVGLGLQGVAPLITRDDVAKKVSGFTDDLDATIHAIRRTIFSLQERVDRPSGLRGEALRIVSEAAAILGFEPHLVFEGPLDSLVPAQVSADVIAVLREGLSNVARHSGASRTVVTLHVDRSGSRCTVTVEDDGVGLDVHDLAGQGTATMAARAQRHGGTFALEGAEPGGARLCWTVPLTAG